ncbi:MAG: Hsp20/alpha crystallin family protein [Minisyncoccia bacterium]
MTMKRSFFDRLSGNSPVENSFDSFDDELPVISSSAHGERGRVNDAAHPAPIDESSAKSDGQLPVDVYQAGGDIIIRAFVAGVKADELNISIRRDMVEIGGSRSERDRVADHDYFSHELFWGSFSRAIMLPQEVDVEASSANAKDGLLTIILPKLDKAKQTKLKVKAG